MEFGEVSKDFQTSSSFRLMHIGPTRKLEDEKLGDVGFTTPNQRPFILHAVSEIKL